MEHQIKQIAQRIRELRAIMGLSPEQMAKVTGVSPEQYLACESGDQDLSFTFIHNCAKEFGVDITDLITGDTARLSSFSIVRKGEGMPLQRRKGFKYNHLASYFKGRLSEPFLVTAKYDPDAAAKPIALSSHEGEEFDYILRGRLRVRIGNHEDILDPGDAIYYNSSEPHGMVAYGEDCEFLAIVTDAHGKAYSYSGAEIKPDIDATAAVSSTANEVAGDFITTVETETGALKEITFQNEDRFNFAFDVVDELAKRYPDKLAMKYVNRDHKVTDFTFSDMQRESARTANYFASLGIGKGDRVMLVLKRHYHFWFSILALHKLGAIVIPATNQLLKKDFDYRFKAAGVKAIVCTADGDVADQVDLAVPGCPTLTTRILADYRGEVTSRDGWHDFNSEYAAFGDTYERTDDTPCGDDPMLMFFTSGTTGYPKIAMHSYKYALGHYVTAKYWHNVRRDGLHFTISDTGWGKALWGKLYGQWLCEAGIFTYDFDRFDAHDILPMFAQHHITTFCAPPTMYRFFIKEDLSKYDLSSIEYATVAGEALNPEVYQQFLSATGVKLMEGFGQTETTLAIANLRGMTPKPGSMGIPSPQFKVVLLGDDGKPVKPGESGEISVDTRDGSPCGLYLGYYNDDAPDHIDRTLTDAAWHDGFYHTGDMAWQDEDGYLWYEGRGDDLIKSSGYRIGPFEIESVIMELPYVLECAITGVPDPIRGQIVKATIVLTKGTEGTDALKKEIQTYVKEHTAPYKYPRMVEFVTELPKTISGKIRRAEIRKG